MTTAQLEAAGLGDAIQDYYNCVVDGVYDVVSADTLQKIADGDADARRWRRPDNTDERVRKLCRI